jgi:sensor domain CHASE-containing protein
MVLMMVVLMALVLAVWLVHTSAAWMVEQRDFWSEKHRVVEMVIYLAVSSVDSMENKLVAMLAIWTDVL